MSKYEIKINFMPDVAELLEISAEVMAKNAVMRIKNEEVEPIKRFLPLQSSWIPQNRNASIDDFEDIQKKMMSDRGQGAVALYDSGALVNSLEPYAIQKMIGKNTLAVSSHLDYAKDHQYGGKSSVSIDQMNYWEGKYKVNFLKEISVNIYPREFVQFGDRELKEVMTVLQTVYERRSKK